jgi:hypothetical protein
MTNAIVKRELTQDTWSMIERVAPVMQKSRLFGVATTEQAMAIMLKGHELGLQLAASFEFVVVIQDKPSLIPRGALALILNSNEYAGMSIDDQRNDKGQPIACVVTMKRKNGFTYTATYTMEDAKQADLVKPGSGWAKYPANMLRWRAVGYAADVVFPDLLGGLKRSDELGADISPDGDIINATWTVKEPQSSQPQPSILLNELITKYGATSILAVNDGKIPQTVEEIATVTAKLEAQAKEAEAITLENVPAMKA